MLEEVQRSECEQPPYNLLDRRVERELLPMARTYGFAIIPWSPLAGGLLTGKYRRGEEPPSDSRFAGYQDNPLQRRRMTERFFDVIEGLQPPAEEKGLTLSQFALAWCLQQPVVTRPITGPRTMEQLEDNLGALDVTLTDDERRQIDRVARRGLPSPAEKRHRRHGKDDAQDVGAAQMLPEEQDRENDRDRRVQRGHGHGQGDPLSRQQ